MLVPEAERYRSSMLPGSWIWATKCDCTVGKTNLLPYPETRGPFSSHEVVYSKASVVFKWHRWVEVSLAGLIWYECHSELPPINLDMVRYSLSASQSRRTIIRLRPYLQNLLSPVRHKKMDIPSHTSTSCASQYISTISLIRLLRLSMSCWFTQIASIQRYRSPSSYHRYDKASANFSVIVSVEP